MSDCTFTKEEFKERKNGVGSCKNAIIKKSLFDHCTSRESGAALYVSSNCYLQLIKVAFSNCVSEKVGGALVCSIKQGLFVDTCYYNCYSVVNYKPGSTDNSYHCAKISGRSSSSTVDVLRCGTLKCPGEPISGDGTIGFRSKSEVSFGYNNMTSNILAGIEMLTVYDECSLSSPISFCSFIKCCSGHLIRCSCKATLEKCNFCMNSPTVKQDLIDNENTFVFKESVFSANKHQSFCSSTRFDASSSFFCSNSFSAPNKDQCLGTNKFLVIHVEKCAFVSILFSAPIRLHELFSIILPIQIMICESYSPVKFV